MLKPLMLLLLQTQRTQPVQRTAKSSIQRKLNLKEMNMLTQRKLRLKNLVTITHWIRGRGLKIRNPQV